MSTIAARLIGGLRALFAKARVEQELDDELRAYLDAAVEQKIAAGMTREQAVRAARAEIGSLEAVKDYTRDSGWESSLEDVWHDVRYAMRSFRRSPGFTAAAIVTIGLGTGGTTAIFSVVDGLFLRAPDGVADPSSLRKIFVHRDQGTVQTPGGGPGSWVDYATMRDHVAAFTGIGASQYPGLVDLGRGPGSAQVRASVVSHEYLQVLGVRPALGRFFLPEEDGPLGATPVAVISHAMWQARFGGTTGVIGRSVLLDGAPLEIVGVTPRGFTGIGADAVDVWLPSSVSRDWSRDSTRDWRLQAEMAGIGYVARLAPTATDATAREQAATALRHAAEQHPALDQTPGVLTSGIAIAAAPYTTRTGDVSLWLAVAAGVVLLIACANVANLLLARGLTRRRELAVRLSIGAGRWRVARQQLTESTVLALLGGAAGILFAYLTMGLMMQFPLPPSAGRIDARLLIFALTVSLVTGLLFGLLPAMRAMQADPAHDLKTTRIVGAALRQRTRGTLVAMQICLSLALLVGALLFVRSLNQVTAIDAGVDIDRLLIARADLTRPDSQSMADEFHARALARLVALPGITHASVVHSEPFNGSSSMMGWRVPGRLGPNGKDLQGAYTNVIGPWYFRTAGTRVLRGREIEPGDAAGEPVAVVNELLAREMADDGNPVGACVPFGRQLKAGGCTRILGVVETYRHRYLEPDGLPTVFLSHAHMPNAIPFGGPGLLIRTEGEPADHVAAVRAALQGLNRDLPYVSVKPLAELIRDDVLPFRLGALLFGLFAGLALVLAGVGLYGVLGYFVSDRTPEIGIRRALGAPARTVVNLVARQSLIPVAAGLTIGLLVAFGGSRYLASLLFGVDARDAASFAGAVLFLVSVAILATLLPALRAARVDPMTALRSE